MAPKLDLEARMTIQKLHERGVPNTRIARVLGVTEGDVRYHLKRQAEGAKDGRSGRQVHLAAGYKEAIGAWMKKRPKGSILARNRIRVEGKEPESSYVEFDQVTIPTPVQKKTFGLLGVTLAL